MNTIKTAIISCCYRCYFLELPRATPRPKKKISGIIAKVPSNARCLSSQTVKRYNCFKIKSSIKWTSTICHWLLNKTQCLQTRSTDIFRLSQSSCSRWNACRNTETKHLSTKFQQLTTTQHTRLTALFPGPLGWAGTRKVKPIWILLKQETVSESGTSWAICLHLAPDR